MTPSDRKALEALVATCQAVETEFIRTGLTNYRMDQIDRFRGTLPIIERLLRDDVVMVPRKALAISEECLEAMEIGGDWGAIFKKMITAAQEEPQ
jgi:hypothetical protein